MVSISIENMLGCMFQELNSFPSAMLLENCEQHGTVDFGGQIDQHKDLKWRLGDIRFKNWGISFREHHQMFPSFSWVIFDHVIPLHQSNMSKNNWWIIICMNTPLPLTNSCGNGDLPGFDSIVEIAITSK